MGEVVLYRAFWVGMWLRSPFPAILVVVAVVVVVAEVEESKNVEEVHRDLERLSLSNVVVWREPCLYFSPALPLLGFSTISSFISEPDFDFSPWQQLLSVLISYVSFSFTFLFLPSMSCFTLLENVFKSWRENALLFALLGKCGHIPWNLLLSIPSVQLCLVLMTWHTD